MSDRAFLDTNIVVYLFDDDSPQRQARAAEILQADGETMELVLSTQVLQEFYVAVTRKLERSLAKEDALIAVRSLIELTVTRIDPDMIVSAIVLSRPRSLRWGGRSAAASSKMLWIGSSSIFSSTKPGRIPASAAGAPGVTELITASPSSRRLFIRS